MGIVYDVSETVFSPSLGFHVKTATSDDVDR
jgi:hypothetical protein